MKNIEEVINYFIKEIDQNELMSKKHKNFWTALNYGEQFLILTSTVTVFYNWMENLCNNCRNEKLYVNN